MSRLKNSFEPNNDSQTSPFGPEKDRNDPKILSKTKVMIE